MDTLKSALEWLSRGVSVVPIPRGSKQCTVKNWDRYQRELPTLGQIHRWFGGPCGFGNIGIVMGWRGLTVLDFDDHDLYSDWLRWADTDNANACLVARFSYAVSTAHGVHVYVWAKERAQTRHLEGLDVKATGYCVGAGSLHPSGALYTALDETADIIQVDSINALVPEWIAPKPETARVSPSLLASNATQYTPSLAGSALLASRGSEALTQPGTLDKPIDAKTLIDLAKWAYPIADMLRIPDSAIKRTGDRGLTLCPFHEDDDPSFSIDFRTNRCFCWAGCCGARGWSILDVWMQQHPGSNVMAAAHALTGL